MYADEEALQPRTSSPVPDAWRGAASEALVTGHIDNLQAVGEIGVILLMFVIGLDSQPRRLWSVPKRA